MCISEKQVARLACRVMARVPVRSPFSLFSHGGSHIFFKLIFQLKIYFWFSNTMSVPDNQRSTHSEKTKNAMKAPRSVKRITFNPSEANPGETLRVFVPKLNENEVLVPGSLALRFDIDLSGGHANNFLVQNVSRALVSQMKLTLAAQPWKIRWTTTYSRHSKTCFCLAKSATTWFLRASRAKI